MESTGLNNPLQQDETPVAGTPEKSRNNQDDLKPTSKGVENAKKRLRAFSIQKKSSLSPVPLPKPICTSVGSVGTVFIGKLASSKPALKPGDIEEVVDPKKPPKPPKPGTSKLQNADYLNIQKKTLSEIEAMKRKMELVDLGIPLGLICPAPNSDKAMPTKAMPPIKSMLLDPAKVDEIIREAKKAKAEGKTFKFSYEKLLPSYQNPFQKNKDKDKDRDREATLPPTDDPRLSRDRRQYSDNYRRYFSHKDENRGRDWHRDFKDNKERMRASIIREREFKEQKIKLSKEKSRRDAKSKERDAKSKERDTKSKERDLKSKDSKSKLKIDTINLSDEDDDDVQEVIEVTKETDVNLKDFVVCDSWSENEDKKDPTPTDKTDEKRDKKDSKGTPLVKRVDPMEQLKQSLTKDAEPLEIKVEKLQPVTDSFKFEIEDDNDDDETTDMFAESTLAIKKIVKKNPIPIVRKDLYSSPVAMRFDYDASVDGMDESFLESVIAEIKQEDIDDDTTQDKGLVEYDASPKDERESVTPELDDRIREMYSSRSDSDGFKSVESVKSTESGFKSTESGYKSTESGLKSTESGYKSTESGRKLTDARAKSIESNLSDGRSKSSESHKSTDSGHKSTGQKKESGYMSTESDSKSTKSGSILRSSQQPRAQEVNMSKSTVDSLETWSFVLKICQPLLFRHDKNKCYKETRSTPKLWFADNPKLCDCVKDRSVVYEELEMCKMELVNSVYRNEQLQESIYPDARGWYPAAILPESGSVSLSSEWEAEDSQERPTPPPHTRDEMVLDREYQKFMEAVWPDVEGAKSETPRNTPVRETKKRPGEEPNVGKKKKVKPAEGKLSSEGWSQESEVDEVLVKNKKQRIDKKRKRKHSSSISDSDEQSPTKKKKKALKKEKKDNTTTKVTKRQRLSKKYIKKLKEKQRKKKKKVAKLEEMSEADEQEREKQKKEKKLMKKKKLLKQKKKASKKKVKARSSPSSSDSESDRKSRKEKKKKRKKRKQSTSESNQSEELFDVNILKNIKTERLTDDERVKNFSPNKKHREIINVKQLQNDFVSIQIKKEIEDVNSPDDFEESFTEDEQKEMARQEERESEKRESEKRESEKRESEKREIEKMELEKMELEKRDLEKRLEENMVEETVEVKENEEKNEHEFKEPEYTCPPTPLKPPPDENSQCSSQDSTVSSKPYEKDDSHLRPSSQNSNYNFHDVMENEGQGENDYQKGGMDIEGDYEQGNYEMYEQMAMEYQSDVASQRVPPPDEHTSGRIETVVRTRSRGEIKCDWRAEDTPPAPSGPAPSAPAPHRPSRWTDPRSGSDPASTNTTQTRPSRWGLKPSDVNIVLTGGEGEHTETFQIQSVLTPTVYKIQSLANRTDNSNTGYDEAYMDMYGASDRLQYGDCFSREMADKEVEKAPVPHHSSLDDRINLALRTTVLGDVAKDETLDESADRGILVTKSLAETRSVKRVTFADGYKPGQDSDTEEPPVRKRKRPRRLGCPWPCPATHRDHVSLWDALPPPPPPPGSPPPPAAAPPPPPHLLRTLRAPQMLQPPHHMAKFDPNSLAAFMPPEPPPGLISF